MVNENLINLTINKKPVELVQELKDYEVKKSPLSPAARAKVIKMYGGNYVSENREDYGPGSEQSKQATASAGVGAGLVITTIICPPLGGAMTTAYAGTGLGMKVIGEVSGNKELAKAGEVLGTGAAIGSMGGGLVSSSGHACAGWKTSAGKEIWKIRK